MTDRPEPASIDEQLSALIDGELDESTASTLEQRIAEEPALARRYRTLRAADDRFRQALAAAADRPLPAEVLRLLEQKDQGAPDAAVVPLRRGHRPAMAPLALAASIALVVGFVAAQLVGPMGNTTSGSLITGTVPEGSALHGMLETRPSGTTGSIGAGTEATPVQTFIAGDGTVCRELQLRQDPESSRALACRRDGAWRVRLSELLPSGSGYQTASVESAVADEVRRLMDGPPLSAEAEAELMADWQNTGER